MMKALLKACEGLCPSNVQPFILLVILQVRPGPVTWTHTAPGEDMVPEQAHEVEENGKRQQPKMCLFNFVYLSFLSSFKVEFFIQFFVWLNFATNVVTCNAGLHCNSKIS